MPKKYSEVYQFKITLDHIKPPIWRRILVPSDYTFWDLHVAIQDSMGWLDYHMHAFTMKNPRTQLIEEIALPNEENEVFGNKIIPENTLNLSDYFNDENKVAKYEYDFGDSWIHTIKFEKILPVSVDEKYPKCIEGKRACPPEDCGSVPGYYHFISVINDPKSEDYEEISEWHGGEYDPEFFDPEEITFEDPQERFEDKLNIF